MIIAILIITTFFIVIGFIISALLKAKFFRSTYRRLLKLTILILVVLYCFTGYLIYKNTLPNELLIKEEYIEFSESYGVRIYFSEIKNIQQVALFPLIDTKESGFSLMDIRKGNFVTESGNRVYALLNGAYTPLLKITKKNNEVIYFNSPDKDVVEEYKKLQNIFSYQKNHFLDH